jgi:hypothetical protein
VLVVIISQGVTQSGVTDAGFDVGIGQFVGLVLHDLVSMVALLAVIAIALAIGFYIASIVKALVPLLAPVAYPVAGGAALAAALYLMKLSFDIFPILGAQTTLGFWLIIGAAAAGGLLFEVFRPKD